MNTQDLGKTMIFNNEEFIIQAIHKNSISIIDKVHQIYKVKNKDIKKFK